MAPGWPCERPQAKTVGLRVICNMCYLSYRCCWSLNPVRPLLNELTNNSNTAWSSILLVFIVYELVFPKMSAGQYVYHIVVGDYISVKWCKFSELFRLFYVFLHFPLPAWSFYPNYWWLFIQNPNVQLLSKLVNPQINAVVWKRD